MNDGGRAALLAELSYDLVLTCDAGTAVVAANSVALRTLGPRLLGKPLLKLTSTLSRPKTEAFLERIRMLGSGEISDSWELLFHVPRSVPLMARARAAALPEGGWLLLANFEALQPSPLYEEVLAINNDLTALVRAVNKKQAALARQLARLQTRRTCFMPTALASRVAALLEASREELIQQTAQTLAAELPMVAVPPHEQVTPTLHKQHMAATARRFHDLVQLAASVDPGMVAHEFGWARRRLQPFGITWDHQLTMIDAYFAAARSQLRWEAEDLHALDELASDIRALGEQAYTG
jgi:hypothetical protein